MKTIQVTDDLWKRIARDRIDLGKKTFWEVIESHEEIAKKIKKEESK